MLPVLALSACKDLGTELDNSADAHLSSATMTMGGNSGGGGGGAELVQYWKAPEELWVYDRRPEPGMVADAGEGILEEPGW
jgi:hypothetical protein